MLGNAKKPYNGSDEEIFLLKNQHIADDKLAQHLSTYDWPDSLKGRSLKFFLSWWEKQSYQWLQEHQPIAQCPPDTQISSPQTKDNQQQPNLNLQITDNKTKSSSQSLFDDMLSELSDEIN